MAATILLDSKDFSPICFKYLEFVNNVRNGQEYGQSQLKYDLASNCVLDWFGRSVCGPNKIQDFLRTEVSSQYEHTSFEISKQCDPIETKPTHFKTISLSSRVDYINPKNRVSGITSLRTRAESDVEEDNDVDMVPPGNKTPEKQQFSTKSLEEQLTPPASSTKNSPHVADDQTSEETDGACQAKRLKRMTGPNPFTYLRTFPVSAAALASKRRQYQEAGIRTLLDDSSGSETEEEPTEKAAAYSSLQYVETSGFLRKKVVNTLDSPHEPNWDRQIRIRISYRERLSDSQLQIALIIYEHLSGTNSRAPPRRNLMNEFQQETEGEQSRNVEGNILVVGNEETTVATVVGSTMPTTSQITSALEGASFTIVPLHTPTKHVHTPPPTPKRHRSRLNNSASSSHKRLNMSPAAANTPKRSAARSLRL